MSNFHSSKDTSVSSEHVEVNRCSVTKTTNGVKVLLLPWINLCSSDSKTMLLVEDALKLLKSTRRSCRFISDVFLHDFPAEIFLNRPAIIQNLLIISNEGSHGRPGEALNVLLCITKTLCTRLSQLTSLDLISEENMVPGDSNELNDSVNFELEQIRDGLPKSPLNEDGLAPLRQLPVPIYALDTLNTVIMIMTRSVVFVDPDDKQEVLNLKELNICVNLVENLVSLLLMCVTNDFWRMNHITETHRSISHKSCTVMRLLGDLLIKYRKSFYQDPDRCHYRVAWLCLVSNAERLLSWANGSPLPPSSLMYALQSAHLDPALDLFYPDLSKKITLSLQNGQTSLDQEYKAKYSEFLKLKSSMKEAVDFMKNKKACQSSKKVLDCIKNSLPALELHLSETYLIDVGDILLNRIRDWNLNEREWSVVRNIALNLMAHNTEWVQGKFYTMLANTVTSVLVGDDTQQTYNEKCLMLLCDVGILTEICCHGLSSKIKEVQVSASEIILYLLRGRLVLSESCWWKLLASLLPVLPLLHVYAAHDTPLGQAICKSLELDIAECMGISVAEVTMGLVRLLFVQCAAVQLDAAHSLCHILDDNKYLPPKELLRADVLINALRRVQPQDFNVEQCRSPTKITQETGLIQILDVLKQDLVLEEHEFEFVSRITTQPILEPSLRRSTLQQLSVMVRQQELHETFLQYDGVKIIVALLRMSLLVEDYLAFPECAISCVSVLNSICFTNRHTLSKITDLPSLLIRVMLVFPANESVVLMSTQILALVAWSGFILQELNTERQRVPALPFNVTERTSLPFKVNSYWSSSPNAKHSSVEWLLSEEEWKAAVRVQWWCAWEGTGRAARGAPPPPASSAPPASPALRPTHLDVAALQATCPLYSCSKALLALQNATSHRQVNEALSLLESYTRLVSLSSVNMEEFCALPWQHMQRFLCTPPASPRDTALLITVLQFIIVYLDNLPSYGGLLSWIKSSFIGNDTSIISFLSQEEFYPQQTSQECIEVTQLHIHIVKVLLRCTIMLDYEDYDSDRLESLLKILLTCLERVDLKNFHMLGYLNELMRCIKYALHTRYSRFSENTLVQCLKIITKTLARCASGGGRKGQACRLDALLSLLALLRQIQAESIPVQRWSEEFSAEVVRSVARASESAGAAVRAAALSVLAALAHYTQLLPQLLQAIPMESLSQYAAYIFSQTGEANVVRVAAADLLTAVTLRASPHSDILECDVLEQLKQNNFVENCLEILVDFCSDKEYRNSLEPNVPVSLLERRAELEVRSHKCGDVNVLPVMNKGRAPPTAALVAALSNVLTNTSVFKNCPVQTWNEQGLYRLLFRCTSWSSGSSSESNLVRAATCRALVFAVAHKCVRITLSATKDCLHNLLNSLTPIRDDYDTTYMEACTQALLLLAALLSEKSTSNTIWVELKENRGQSFFHILLQCLRSDEKDLQDAAMYCLTQLMQALVYKKHPDKTKNESCIEFFDNLKSLNTDDNLNNSYLAGNTGLKDQCQTDYIAEELCKTLICIFLKFSDVSQKNQFSQGDRFARISACLSWTLRCSARARRYGVHRQLPRALLAALQLLRDHLTLSGKPVEVIRNANNNPALRTLCCLLTIINCQMFECLPAKDAFAEDNLATSLNRLWPWCMMTEQLRDAVMHLLLTFTNNCPKAWSAMSMCVGGRNLISETCTLVHREAALQSRTRSEGLLVICLDTLRHCVEHHHCRSIILKSEALSCVCKLRARSAAGAGGSGVAGGAWGACARLCEAAARHADGAAAVLGLRSALAARAPPAPLAAALAHAAHHHRSTFLQSPDLLELLSGMLLTGDTVDVVSASRAVWALAANNHKAKLLLRSAGVSAAVQSALQRYQRCPLSSESRRALELLTYTNTVLQGT